ncbi:Cation-transporting ATPase [Quillaja saponaria]|uniref:Cation-transporting ATPase n=1 Tax=Quillaja saponaria TaxID=32244 RepID=A0AAD7PL22_QUISA|nr:Cation-transporting ATPase [Quillaja saponaria]
MEEEGNSVIVQEQSLSKSGSDCKTIGEKRNSTHLGEKHDLARKRVKMRDLESVLVSEETNTHNPNHTRDKVNRVHISFCEEDMSQVTKVPIILDYDALQAEKSGRDTFPVEVKPAPGALDLNTEAGFANNSPSDGSSDCAENPDKEPLLREPDSKCHSNFETSKGVGVDLNAEDVSSSGNPPTFYPHNEHGHLKSTDVSECGSCTGPLEENDSMRIWKEMKQNGFVSSSHGGIPLPKQRGRKCKSDVLKKKMELAKREQVNRFTKIAAPSGLLNELNPGIINHVRNRKQVHSIIEALVRSEKHENDNTGSKNANHLTSGTMGTSEKKHLEYLDVVGINELPSSDEEETCNTYSGNKQTKGYPSLVSNSPWSFEDQGGDSDSCMVERAKLKSCATISTHVTENDILALRLSSSIKASENSSTLSNEESSNFTSISSLSVKAATVASQWLEILHQDIKGRLSTLRRSKRRVRAVITTELPFLISKEFLSNQENDPYVMKSSFGLSNNTIVDMHQTRWSELFDQMERSLSEEEKQLESWLNQVKEKQLQCDQGLQHVHWNTAYGLQQQATSVDDSRAQAADSSEKELAVRAAAASIYSTCNFLSSGNVTCF